MEEGVCFANSDSVEDEVDTVCGSMGSPLEHHFHFIMASAVHNVDGNSASESVYTCMSRRGLEYLRVRSKLSSMMSVCPPAKGRTDSKDCKAVAISEGH